MGVYERYLAHHGVKGQRWGIRRYQDYDGHRLRDGRTINKYEFKDTDYRVFRKNGELSRIQKERIYEKYPFYATYTTHDKRAYLGMFGTNLMRRGRREAESLLKKAEQAGDYDEIEKAKKNLDGVNKMIVYQHRLAAESDIKIPSTKRAAEIASEMIQKPKFKEEVKESIQVMKKGFRRPQQQTVLSKAEKALNKEDTSRLSEKEKRDVYAAINMSLVLHDKNNNTIQNKFYRELKKYGYGALGDLNDQVLSSYHAKDPLIIFDTEKVKSKAMDEADQKTVEKLNKVYGTERYLKELMNVIPSIYKSRQGQLYQGDLLVIDGRLVLDDPSNYLAHHGTKGMKWGVRRYQNLDGSLTAAGYVHYGYGKAKSGAKSAVSAAKTAKSKIDTGIAEANEKRRKALKEKASKTADGVAKHPELFDEEELVALKSRFEVEKFIRNQAKDERAAKRQVREEHKAEKFKKKKEAALKSPKKLLKNKKLFTNEELEEAKQRFAKEAAIRRADIDRQYEEKMARVERGKQYADLISKGASAVKSTVETTKALNDLSIALTGKNLLGKTSQPKDSNNNNNNNKNNDNNNNNNQTRNPNANSGQNPGSNPQQPRRPNPGSNPQQPKPPNSGSTPKGNTPTPNDRVILGAKDRVKAPGTVVLGAKDRVRKPGDSNSNDRVILGAKDRVKAPGTVVLGAKDRVKNKKQGDSDTNETLKFAKRYGLSANTLREIQELSKYGNSALSAFGKPGSELTTREERLWNLSRKFKNIKHGDLLVIDGRLVLDKPSNYLSHTEIKRRA